MLRRAGKSCGRGSLFCQAHTDWSVEPQALGDVPMVYCAKVTYQSTNGYRYKHRTFAQQTIGKSPKCLRVECSKNPSTHIDVLQCSIPGYLTLTTVSFWHLAGLQICGVATFSCSTFGKGKSSDFTNWGWAVRPGTASRSGPGHPLVSLQACNTTIRCGPDDSWLLYVALCINQYQLNPFGRVF